MLIGSGNGRSGSSLAEAPVWPMLAVEALELPEHMREVALVPDQGAVQ
jgi:hypothetical protein